MDNDMNETGNGMVIRETMMKCLQILSNKFSCRTGNFIIFYNQDIDQVINMLHDALAEPLRNKERFLECLMQFCYGCQNRNCLCNNTARHCILTWLLDFPKKGGENNS